MKNAFHILLVFFLLCGVPLSAQTSERNVRFQMTYFIMPQQDTENIRFSAPVPVSVEGKQEIINLSLDPMPDSIVSSSYGSVGFWNFQSPGDTQRVKIKFDVRLFLFDLHFANTAELERNGSGNSGNFLSSGPFFPTQDSLIQVLIKGIPDGNAIHTVIKRLYHKTITSMTWADDSVQRDLREALLQRKGNPLNYADLFVTLCRAKSIPARVITGYIAARGTGTHFHNWVEVFTEKYGWIPFDPYLGDRKAVTFQNLRNIYVYLTMNRSEGYIRNNGYYDLVPENQAEIIHRLVWSEL